MANCECGAQLEVAFLDGEPVTVCPTCDLDAKPEHKVIRMKNGAKIWAGIDLARLDIPYIRTERHKDYTWMIESYLPPGGAINAQRTLINGYSVERAGNKFSVVQFINGLREYMEVISVNPGEAHQININEGRLVIHNEGEP